MATLNILEKPRAQFVIEIIGAFPWAPLNYIFSDLIEKVREGFYRYLFMGEINENLDKWLKIFSPTIPV